MENWRERYALNGWQCRSQRVFTNALIDNWGQRRWEIRYNSRTRKAMAVVGWKGAQGMSPYRRMAEVTKTSPGRYSMVTLWDPSRGKLVKKYNLNRDEFSYGTNQPHRLCCCLQWRHLQVAHRYLSFLRLREQASNPYMRQQGRVIVVQRPLCVVHFGLDESGNYEFEGVLK